MEKMSKWRRTYLKFRMFFIPDGPLGDRARGKLYEPYLKRIGKNFKVASQAFIYNPNGLEVGDNVYIGFSSYLGEGSITLEDEVLIGNFVSITATNHQKKSGSYRFGGYATKPIVVGKGTWIAAHACVTAGVTIGEGVLVAAGAVVTESINNHETVGGIPAKKIK